MVLSVAGLALYLASSPNLFVGNNILIKLVKFPFHLRAVDEIIATTNRSSPPRLIGKQLQVFISKCQVFLVSHLNDAALSIEEKFSIEQFLLR
jgi:hypothetical protein